MDHIERLEHQARFDLGRVAEGDQIREELLHQLRHAAAHAGGVDADVGHPVPARDALDLGGLLGKVHAPELDALQQPELAARLLRWRQHD